MKIGQTVEEEFEKVGFQHKSKWLTGSSAFYDFHSKKNEKKRKL